MPTLSGVRIVSMITVLTGNNSFEITRAINQIARSFDGVTEKFEGSNLEVAQLPDLLQGGTLFANERLVIIKDVSENQRIWETLPDWITRVSDDVHLVLVETKPDKRTKTYKDLQKNTEIKTFLAWGDRDTFIAEKWVADEAKRQNITIDKKCIQLLVERVGLDQWLLFHALEKLSILDEVTPDVIGRTIIANPTENVFNLFDCALRGDVKKVHEMIQILERTEDPYRTFGLLSGQVVQLATLVVADKKPSEVATDIGTHPYALGKLAPYAKKFGKKDVQKMTKLFADTDREMKSSAIDPWLLVEKTLTKTASF